MKNENEIESKMIRKLTYGRGYQGKHGQRPWVALILGSDARTHYQRQFLDPVHVTVVHPQRHRTEIELEYELGVGLYELCADGERWFVVCVPQAADLNILKCHRPTDDRIRRWVAALDQGLSQEEARLASKAAV